MKTVKMHEAKSNLSALVRDVSTGVQSEIVICVGGRPAARLLPFDERPKRQLGVDRGLIAIASGFDAVDSAIAQLFEGAEE